MLVSKVIFSLHNICADFVLHCKQAINLKPGPLLIVKSDRRSYTVHPEWKIDTRFIFFIFFIFSLHLSWCLSLSLSYLSTTSSPCFCEVIWIGIVLRLLSWVLQHQNISFRSSAALLDPLFLELSSPGVGSMHSGADAVAFPQGDGCCGVYKAT